MILSFDTSLPVLSVALVDNGTPLGSIILEGAGSRNEKLLPAVDWLLTELGRSLADVDLLVVTKGPGSFTGVRIGLATAQGLAFSRGVQLLAMSTHEAVAELQGPCLVFGDAGRGELYRTRFLHGIPVGEPEIVSREAAHEEGAVSIDVNEICRHRNVAQFAAMRALAASEDLRESWRDPTPIYVRPSAAEEKLSRTRRR